MKNLKQILITLLTFFGMFQLNAQEFISGVGVNYNIGKKWNILGELQNRNNRASEVNTNSWIFQGKIGYNLFKQVNLSLTYRNTSTKTINHFAESDIKKNDKNRYTANITIKSKRYDNKIRFSSRFRYQYSEHEKKGSKEYIRYKISVDHKLSKNANPYIAIEPYYYLNKNKLKDVRFYLGNEFSFNQAKLDIFLITETDPENEVFTMHYMLGATIKFYFNAFK